MPMPCENIKIKDILVNDSRFSIKKYIFEQYTEESCQSHSFKTLGILYPVILHKDEKGQLHMVDGSKRVHFAIKNRQDMVRGTVLPRTTAVTDIITLILCNKSSEVFSSVINKIQFIYFVISLNAPEAWILNSLCPAFEFRPHNEFLRECERISNLPEELRHFCHEKKLSLKQILNLTYHPQDLLIQMVKWNSTLQLTASVMDEIASYLKGYLKLHNKSLKEFLSEPEVLDILESSLSPRDKTESLRQLLHLKRFPVLSEVNARIEHTVDDLKLPRNIHLSWDKTLENKNLSLSIDIKDPNHWTALTEALKSPKVKKAIKSILDEL